LLLLVVAAAEQTKGMQALVAVVVLADLSQEISP
jgi:hypothetical protein